MESYPLISAVIIHYNNGDFIYETISSVLMQDYPNIELLISDDCSPEGFDVDNIIEFINANRKENLKRVVINENKKNLGTVRNLETIRAKELGEFELLIAGDDVWRDKHVFSAFAECFEELGDKAEWIVSQVEMCDEKLDKVLELFVKPDTIRMIRKEEFDELLTKDVDTVCLPSAGTAFRQSFFQKVYGLAEHYNLIEDYPTQLRALRMGIPVYYLDIISVKHRHGGVSHGNQRNGNAIYIRYLRDFLKIFEMEIFLYEMQFNTQAYHRAKERYAWYCQQYSKEMMQKQETGTALYVKQKKQDLHIKDLLKAFKPAIISFANKGKIENNINLIIKLLLCATLLPWGEGVIPLSILLIGIEYGVILVTTVAAMRITMLGILSVRSRIALWRR